MLTIPTAAPAAKKDELLDWRALELVIRKVEADAAAPKTPLPSKIAGWYLGMDLLRECEDEHLYLEDPTPTELKFHRMLLQRLISIGELVLAEARARDQTDIPEYDSEVVAANVRYLKDVHARWHLEMSEEERKAVLKQCFGIEE